MAPSDVVHVITGTDTHRRSRFKGFKRAFSKFLAVPFLLVVVFLMMGVLLVVLERSEIGWIALLRGLLTQLLFDNGDVTSGFLGAAAGGMITLTSITISMLLLVLQQTASNMGNMVYDQFLTRRRNQIYAGFIVGGAVLAVFVRAMVTEESSLVLGATFVLLVVILALVGLLWFLYMTINQMRPSTVVNDIYDKTKDAYRQHRRFLRRTRRTPQSEAPVRAVLHARSGGYVTEIDPDAIADCLRDQGADVEIVSKVVIGGYVAYRDVMAEVKAPDAEVGRRVAECLGRAFYVEERRQLDDDPAFGLRQLEMIAWAEVSTAKQNPETGLMVGRALQDLLSRWVLGADEVDVEGDPVALVYGDKVLRDALDVLESVAVVSSESLQHQNFAEVLNTLRVLYPRLPSELQARVDDLLRRAVSAMGDHVLTRDLEQAVEGLAGVLREAGSGEAARMLEGAGKELRASVGALGSRSTRVKAGG